MDSDATHTRSSFFLAALPIAKRLEIKRFDALESTLVEMIRAAKATWGDVAVSDDAFLGALARSVGDSVSIEEALTKIHASDLFLTTGCALGLAPAIAAFEAHCFGRIDAIVRRCRPRGVQADDLLQMLREKLFVRPKEGMAMIATYGGRGDLRTWFRVVATRLTLNVATRGPKENVAAEEDASLIDYVDGQEGPEMLHMRSLYDAELRGAFPSAFAALSVRERLLLRQRYLDDLSLDEVSALHGVHRATIKRQLATARASLTESLRASLMQRLKLTPGELQSILQMIQSRFHVTLRRMLDRTPADES